MNYETYLNHITAYEREFAPWQRKVEKILKRYRDDERSEQSESARFNILWSNVQTLKAATYARTPMPDVSRRFKDNDPVGRVAALLLERTLEFQVRHFRDYAATLGQCTYDRFIGGRGTAWVRYEPTFAEKGEISEDAETETKTGEEIEDENCPTDYVHWKDFGCQVSRTWEECTLVWRKVYLSKSQAKERFPEDNLPMDSSPDENHKVSDQQNTDKQALVYELWDKDTGNAVWLSRSLGRILETKPDPLGLEEFFPCPPPLTATLTTDTQVPIPDYTLYQDQARELDVLAERIAGLIKMLQVKGVYDSSIPELARLFNEGENGTLIPVKNWAAFAEKKGLGGAVDLFEILPIAQALVEAYKAFEQVKNQIYELTGISDILRGETAPSETATAQQIKNSYASLRLKVYQSEVEKFATRLLQLKAEIICNHFDPQTILKLACVEQMSQADQQLVPKALEMLKGGVTRSFRVEVETDSMAYQDEQQEKQDRMEFLQAVGNYLDIVSKIAAGMPSLLPLSVEMLKFCVTGFRVGKNLEGTIDLAVEQMKQQAQQPRPNPEQVKAQAAAQLQQMKGQADVQQTQIETQADVQKAQATEQAKAQASVAIANAQSQADARTEQMRMQHEAQLHQMQAASDERMAAMQASQQAMADRMNQNMQLILQRMKGDVALEVAEIGAQTTLDAAQISAARSADDA